MGSRKKRGLSADDQRIWQQVARTLTPLSSGEAAKPEDGRDVPASMSVKPKRYDMPSAHTAIKPPEITYNLLPDPIAALRDATPALDKRTYDRFRKGKITPDRRIDLHGRTLDAAQKALSRFILQARSDGCRVVLVITGKGRMSHDDGSTAIPRRPGAIRQNLPMWLASPPLKDAVVQIMPAQLRDGGTGAFYVYLRRMR